MTSQTLYGRKRMRLSILASLLCIASTASAGEGHVVTIHTRPNVSVSYYFLQSPDATATVVLLPGGEGDIALDNGAPTSKNFLVRSRDYFAAHALNVAVLDRPSDRTEMGYVYRVSNEHIEDMRKIVVHLKKVTRLPVWLVGTSRGTISAAAAAIAFGSDELAGIVLTSSVTDRKKTGAVPSQSLRKIRIPVLVLHHTYDACKICSPGDASDIIHGLTNAPVKKLILVQGGGNPTDDPCGPLHWHGYVGMEKEAVNIIAGWIAHPVP